MTAWTPPDADGVVEELDLPEASDLEQRAGIASLDELQTRRRLILERNTKLFALHGSFGLFDNFRKKMLECEKVRIRMELTKQEFKVTETMIDAAAHASELYGSFLDTALEEKVEYLRLSTEITEIEEAIRSRELELTSYNRELALR